jgi:hypothetical protein
MRPPGRLAVGGWRIFEWLNSQARMGTMTQQTGTKQVMVNGQTVTVRIFAAKQSRTRNEDVAHAQRLCDVRYQSTPEDIAEFLESA